MLSSNKSHTIKPKNSITMAIVPLLFLVLTLIPISHSKVFVSIDCGADSNYMDENSIKWIGDEALMSEGKSYTVKDSSGFQELNTLRAFTGGTRKKYCYAVGVEKGGQVLVRTSFYYGNYDGKSSPPSFTVHGDGNLWDTVSFSDDQDIYTLETIYVAKWDHVSVCVAQTEPGKFPFISALEVRSLCPKMYGHVNSSYALMTRHTTAYGSTGYIRYPDDAYDREWYPEYIDHNYTTLTNDASSIKVDVADDPPEAVFHNAVTTSSTSKPLILSTDIERTVPIYMTMYFSEVMDLDPTDKRSFVFTIDGRVASEPIVPPYKSVLEMYLTNSTASPQTEYALVATKDSTLPPLINAMEVFYVFGPLTEGTHSRDLESLGSLQKKFSVLQDWYGDPCLPLGSTWDWVNCSSDHRPRITALYLGGFGLNGSIPDFSSLDALTTIDMSKNSLTGSIPEFLGKLPNLKELNLEDNKLSGSIPTSLSNNTNLKLYTSGNRVLCGSSKVPSCTQRSQSKSSSYERKSTKPAISFGAIISILFLVFY